MRIIKGSRGLGVESLLASHPVKAFTACYFLLVQFTRNPTSPGEGGVAGWELKIPTPAARMRGTESTQ